MLVPEPGWLVKRAKDPDEFAAALARALPSPERPLYARVFAEPELSLSRALVEQPPKPGRIYLPLATKGGH